jgi:hypothetical protein
VSAAPSRATTGSTLTWTVARIALFSSPFPLSPGSPKTARARAAAAATAASGATRLLSCRQRSKAWSSALAKSTTVSNRSAGTFASARRTTASSVGVTVSRATLAEGGGWPNCLAMIACAVGPENGGSPASISYSMQPRE